MEAKDRVIAAMSPDDTAAALRLLKVLEECRRGVATADHGVGAVQRSGGGDDAECVRLAAPSATVPFFFSAVERCGPRARRARIVGERPRLDFDEAQPAPATTRLTAAAEERLCFAWRMA
jgi:hypothetical protein